MLLSIFYCYQSQQMLNCNNYTKTSPKGQLLYLALRKYRMNRTKLKISIITHVLRTINSLLPTDSIGEPHRKLTLSFREKVNNIPDACLLEIGSRNVTGTVHRGNYKSVKEYVGFDYHAGENVDVVGDAHKLSGYLPHEHFDAVFSNVVFEHIAMPWKAVLEINKVMKKGGLLLINTHPAWPPHELPWDFWRYQKASFAALLNKKTGFKILACEERDRASLVAYSRHLSKACRNMPKNSVYLSVGVMAEKIGPADETLSWNVDLEDFVEGIYPPPKAL
jgi:SAM-dependent methyltransferase